MNITEIHIFFAFISYRLKEYPPIIPTNKDKIVTLIAIIKELSEYCKKLPI
jgi:hypothetical protein